MIKGIWGRKIGMTQVFAKDKVVPVTAIDIADWYVTNVKTKQRDGYDAIQVGSVKNRYKETTYNKDWIKSPRRYYSFVREIPLEKDVKSFAVGEAVDFSRHIQLGKHVDVFGITIGK